VIEKGGSGIFKHHSSLGQALKALYPHFPWQLSQFVDSGQGIRGYWLENSNLLEALEIAGLKLGITRVSLFNFLNVL